MKRREEMSSLKDLESLKEEGINSLFPSKTKILVGMATCGQRGKEEKDRRFSEEDRLYRFVPA